MMFGSQVIETALGLVFIYLLCSLVCSGIHDWIAGALNTKADALEKRLGELLQNPQLLKAFYDHPLIKGQAYKSLYDKLFRRDAKPAFIDPQVFAVVLAELMKDKNFNIDQLYQGEHETIVKKNILKTLLGVVNDEMTDTVADVKDQLELKARLVKDKIESWFEVSMIQMSAWYKQKARFVIFFIAIVVVVAFNIDSLTIGKVLFQDETVRRAVVTAAEKELSGENVKSAGTEDSPMAQARLLEAKITDLGLPLGWKWDKPITEDLSGQPNSCKSWFLKIIGLLLTIVAASMGAPFWFDILRRMMRLRGGQKASI